MGLLLEWVFSRQKHCLGCILGLGHGLHMLLEIALEPDYKKAKHETSKGKHDNYVTKRVRILGKRLTLVSISRPVAIRYCFLGFLASLEEQH